MVEIDHPIMSCPLILAKGLSAVMEIDNDDDDDDDDDRVVVACT